MRRKLRLFLIAAPVMAASLLAWAGATKVVERIIARVNNEIITQRTYERELDRLRQELSRQYSGPALDAQVREQSKNLLRDLIDQALMVQKAKDLDINVETDVVKRLDQIRKDSNLKSLEDLQKEVENQGMIWEDFKDGIRRRLLMQEVIGREVGGRIIISHEDARKFFEEHKKEFESPGGVHLAQIFISSETRKPEEAEKRAQEVMTEIKAGTRFAELAKKYSDDPTAAEGGDAGFYKAGTMAPVISEATKNLEVGDTSGLVKLKNGFMVFKVLEKLRPGIPAFEEVEQRVDEYMYNQKMQPALRKYLTTLRKDSYVTLAPGYVDSGAERPSEAGTAEEAQ